MIANRRQTPLIGGNPQLLAAAAVLLLIQSAVAGAQASRLTLIDGVPAGSILVHGDIVVPEDQYLRGSFCPDAWPEGVVYFEFDANVSADNRRKALEAMDEWIGSSADVVFIPRGGQAAFTHIRDSSNDADPRNDSSIGMTGDEQIINIVSWNSRFTIAHELCHTLGLWHDQSRPDRDGFVEIVTDNIEGDHASNFDTEPCWPSLDTEYDFDSVMPYDDCAFSVCAQCPSFFCSEFSHDGRTIVMRPGFESFQGAIGQRTHLSTVDIADMVDVYGSGEATFVDGAAPAQNGRGTLADPYADLSLGAATVPASEDLWIRSGTYDAAGLYDRASTWQGYSGSVVIH